MKVFEPFRLDPVNHCLWRDGARVPLTPKAFDVLRYLVDRSERVVTQAEILEALWPETYVNPEVIRRYILEIRKVLGDRPSRSRFIETVPKRGYQFVAKVTGEGTPAPLRVAAEGGGSVVGRESELGVLAANLDKALRGHRKMIFLTGEAGMGKTTLVDMFQRQAARHSNLRIARGQCIEGFAGKEAYYPVLEAVGSLLRNEVGDSWAETLARHAPTWLIQFPFHVSVEQRALLQREILGSTRERMVREICEVLEVITAQTPLVVILEDLHWADHSTLDLISALARRRQPAKLLLLGTYRPLDLVLTQSPLKALKQDLLLRDLCHEIAVERLEKSEVAQYLSEEFPGNEFPPGLAALVHHNSGGNALFMSEIVRDIKKKGLIAEGRDAWTLTAPLPDVYPGIPDTLQKMLEIQFERFAPEEQRVLESCSVAGERCSVWAAARMLGTAPEPVEEICERLARRQQFIRFTGIHDAPHGVESAHYEFRHSLYRQALYQRLSSPSRSRLHRAMGDALAPFCNAGKPELASELALHFEQGRDFERATRYWILAADNATSLFPHRDSIEILRRALDLVPALTPPAGLELEIQILQRIGDLLYALGEMSESSASYQAAVDRAAGAGLDAAQVDALVRLADPVRHIDPVRGDEIFRQALEISKGLTDPLLVARTHLAAASFRLLYDSWREEDAEAGARAWDAIRRLSSGSPPQDTFYPYVQAVRGDYQEALKQADASIAAATNKSSHILAVGAKYLALLLSGGFGEALRILRSEKALTEKDGGDPWLHVLAEVHLRGLCFDYDGVRRLGRKVMQSNAEQHDVRARTFVTVASGYSEIQRGRFDEAQRCFARVRDRKITSRFLLHWYWRMQAEHGTAEAMLCAGDVAGARREAGGFLKSALSTGDANMRARAWELKSRIATAGEDFARAREYLENALAILDKSDIPVVAWQVHATASDLFRLENDNARADAHRARARELIMRLADSFDPGEPLRESLLSAPPVRRIFDLAVSI